MGKDGKRFPLAVFADQPVVTALSLFVSSQEETGCFGESPFEMDIADFAVLGTKLLSTGFSGAFDQAAIRDEVLHPVKPVNILNLIQDNQAQDLPDAGKTPKQIKASDIVLLGLLNDVEFQIVNQPVIEFHQLQIHLDTFLDGGIGKMTGYANTICLVRYFLFKHGKIILTIGVLDMRQQFSSFMHEVVSPPQEVPGGAHGFGIDIGSRQVSTPKQSGNLLGVDFVIFTLAAMDRFHV